MNDEFSDYLSAEEQKLLAKQAKCEHKGEIIICFKCKNCGLWWTKKTKDLTLKTGGYCK